MFLFLLLIAYIVVLAIYVNEGWKKTKEIVQKGEKPNIYLVLYTAASCTLLFPLITVLYFRMINAEQIGMGNKAIKETVDQDQGKSVENQT